MTTSVALIGAGYWGKNLVRNFHALGALRTICDASPEIQAAMSKEYSGVQVTKDVQSILADSSVQGVVIGAPAATHYDLTKQALLAGKDVFVEKPLALKLSEGAELVELARSKERVLMVGHILQYHPGIGRLYEIVRSPEFGKLEYVYSNRLNLGKIRTEENILWSFAPHDISILLGLTGALPIQVTAVGGSYLTPNVPDTTISTYVFDQGVRAHIYVSWLHPFKEQRLVVVGEKQMLTFNDQAPKGQKLLLHPKNVERVAGGFVAKKPEGAPVAFDEEREPLRSECEHFLECMRTRATPRTDGVEGLRVLTVLDACQRSLQMSGQPVQVRDYRG